MTIAIVATITFLVGLFAGIPYGWIARQSNYERQWRESMHAVQQTYEVHMPMPEGAEA